MIVVAAMMVVRLYDLVGVPQPDRNAAEATAAAILHDAGVDLRWRDCTDPAACGDSLQRAELVVRLLAGDESHDAGVLGYSFVDVEHHAGTLATVFDDRVSDLARRAAVDHGELLGRTIAHELGHLLLGRASHSRDGLMRAHWTVDAVRRRRADDWRWSPEEQTAVRMAAATRAADLHQLIAQLAIAAAIRLGAAG